MQPSTFTENIPMTVDEGLGSNTEASTSSANYPRRAKVFGIGTAILAVGCLLSFVVAKVAGTPPSFMTSMTSNINLYLEDDSYLRISGFGSSCLSLNGHYNAADGYMMGATTKYYTKGSLTLFYNAHEQICDDDGWFSAGCQGEGGIHKGKEDPWNGRWIIVDGTVDKHRLSRRVHQSSTVLARRLCLGKVLTSGCTWTCERTSTWVPTNEFTISIT